MLGLLAAMAATAWMTALGLLAALVLEVALGLLTALGMLATMVLEAALGLLTGLGLADRHGCYGLAGRPGPVSRPGACRHGWWRWPWPC